MSLVYLQQGNGKKFKKWMKSANIDEENLPIFRVTWKIQVNNNMYNQKLPHIYVMTKWMAINYFLS